MNDKEQIQLSLGKLIDYLQKIASVSKRNEYEDLLEKIKVVENALKICEEYL